MSGHGRRIHLAARLRGAGGTTVRAGPRATPQIAFPSFGHLDRTAERGPFGSLSLERLLI